jgi:large subunit ribosomal protein L32
MACPKKKTSKSKRDMRRSNWKRKASLQAERALSIGKSILTQRAQGFYFPEQDQAEDESES